MANNRDYGNNSGRRSSQRRDEDDDRYYSNRSRYSQDYDDDNYSGRSSINDDDYDTTGNTQGFGREFSGSSTRWGSQGDHNSGMHRNQSGSLRSGDNYGSRSGSVRGSHPERDYEGRRMNYGMGEGNRSHDDYNNLRDARNSGGDDYYDNRYSQRSLGRNQQYGNWSRDDDSDYGSSSRNYQSNHWQNDDDQYGSRGGNRGSSSQYDAYRYENRGRSNDSWTGNSGRDYEDKSGRSSQRSSSGSSYGSESNMTGRSNYGKTNSQDRYDLERDLDRNRGTHYSGYNQRGSEYSGTKRDRFDDDQREFRGSRSGSDSGSGSSDNRRGRGNNDRNY